MSFMNYILKADALWLIAPVLGGAPFHLTDSQGLVQGQMLWLFPCTPQNYIPERLEYAIEFLRN